MAFIPTIRWRTSFFAIVIFFASILATLATVQASAQAEDSPTTKLREFRARTGSVIMLNGTRVGTIKGVHEGQLMIKSPWSVDVNTDDLVDISTSEQVSGIEIIIKAKLADRGQVFIDEEEIPSLLEGLDHISNAIKERTKFFLLLYRTKDHLLIEVYRDGTVHVSRDGRTAVARFNAEEFASFIALIVKARDML